MRPAVLGKKPTCVFVLCGRNGKKWNREKKQKKQKAVPSTQSPTSQREKVSLRSVDMCLLEARREVSRPVSYRLRAFRGFFFSACKRRVEEVEEVEEEGQRRRDGGGGAGGGDEADEIEIEVGGYRNRTLHFALLCSRARPPPHPPPLPLPAPQRPPP